ncbi:bifunctional 3-deoxy-7-phosphoheptulonate synthase/chorismate mutase [Candidatus Obscuribacterales bacterium]|nr:bifunctional 3-deoxy-7-phosphoheptulonate synthase/chorismate mutase [Candidatus Obscuribacterales bacterium]
MSTNLKASITETQKRTVVEIADGVTCGGRSLLIVAGPCSVESKEQMDQVGAALRGQGVSALRGGVYKPRTSPYAFQGLGEEGLQILSDTSKKYGMPVITEVMSEKQADIAVHTADVLQIGSRNMQNFELLKHIGTLRKPVILKRGLSATLEELVNAAEYILAGGNDQVILCERGIRSYDNATRNVLDLGGVVALRQMTHLPILVDPSHACGRRELVADLARAAIACGADGLMIECHPEPEKSVSDARQAIHMDDMIEIIRSIEPIAAAVGRTICNPTLVKGVDEPQAEIKESHKLTGYETLVAELKDIRREIDKTDTRIAALLEERLMLAMRAGELKQELKVPSRDVAREREVLDLVGLACTDPRVAARVRNIYERIMDASRQIQVENALPKRVVA